MSRFVGYYRVSTQGQGRSGLSLDAQKEAVRSYVNSVEGELIAQFEEVESGANAERARLKAAVRTCKVAKAMLVIAKLDRLARSVHFISELMESGVDFIAADMPTANKLTIHIIAAMAEYERDVISQRTKAALRAARARGIALGNPNIRAQSLVGITRKKQIADSFAVEVYPKIARLMKDEGASLARTALILEAEGVKTPRGGRWSATTVLNILKRIADIKNVPHAAVEA